MPRHGVKVWSIKVYRHIEDDYLEIRVGSLIPKHNKVHSLNGFDVLEWAGIKHSFIEESVFHASNEDIDKFRNRMIKEFEDKIKDLKEDGPIGILYEHFMLEHRTIKERMG